VLLELHIAGLGVIEDLDLELHPGLNVLTGETGAGKTMITLGLGLALGGRASSVLARRGAGKARVEARFAAPPSPSVVEWAEDGELVLARTVGEDGRSSARIGGQIVPISTLAALGPELVEVHGQNQHQRLLSASAQTEFLDRFAGREHLASVAEYREAFDRLRRLRLRLEELDRETREREREKDLLAYQVREIEAAGVRVGELVELAAEEGRLGHTERLLERAAVAGDALASDGAATDRLHEAATALRDAGTVDPEATVLGERATGLAEEAAELARDLRAWRESLGSDPARLEEIRERVHAVRGLERKYGEGEEGILAFLQEASLRLEALAGVDDERSAIEREVEDLDGLVTAMASRVTEGRGGAAPRLADALQNEVRQLGMEGAAVRVDLPGDDQLGLSGRERAELLFSGGPGQPELPLSRVASGGEVSRTMLACRSVMADLDDVATLVFDEVDAGIGGRAGTAVGKRLSRLAKDRQVLVVTHLAQIACFADRHARVRKEGGVATVEALEGEERVREVARMLSGSPGSRSATEHAEELLEGASAERDGRAPAAARRPRR
jgi:DNA repair protein RecN (Recombination protein N)